MLDLGQRPTHVHELVVRPSDYRGYCDASAFGAGGGLVQWCMSLMPAGVALGVAC